MINIMRIKKKLYLVVVLLLLPLSCIAQKKAVVNNKSDYLTAINNAIIDFCKTSSLIKDNNTFYVTYKDLNDKIIRVSIIGNVNKFYIAANTPVNRLPHNYSECTKKLFYWYDDNISHNSEDVIRKLKEYRLIEYNPDIIEASIDDKKKGISYYFCKNNLTTYKKVKSNFSQNSVPELSCK